MNDIEKSFTIGMIGLGYVGLPLAVEFGKKFKTIGLDINETRVRELKEGVDVTLEVTPETLKEAKHLTYTSKLEGLRSCNFFIITVPTPIDVYKRPELSAIIGATESVGTILKKGDIVVYESTVYPGLTEELCVPILEKKSELKFNLDFFVGYSPERINPGDKEHTVTKILKIVSGSTPETLEKVAAVYGKIITAGLHRAETIRVAEAAKVIENTQRDVNIALINELTLLFNRLGIDTDDVLRAARTKWNFLPFSPGLVGGHCIGVDPYYLTHKAQEVGFHTDVILAGRRINDSMGSHVASEVIKLMTQKKIQVVDSHILILGLTFKENCPDIRNTRVVDIVHELQQYNTHVDIYDPWASKEDVEKEYKITLTPKPSDNGYDAVILAVAHNQFAKWTREYLYSIAKIESVIYDVKHLWNREWVDGRL
ncbi:MAG: nucleotide sugar dehydrogenase [Nitrospirota bacterium]